MNYWIKKTSSIIILLIPITVIGINQELSIKNRVVNPEGWNLPDLSRLEKVSSGVKKFPGIEPLIQIEEYHEATDLVQIRNKKIALDMYTKEKKIVPDVYVIDSTITFSTYKIYENQKVLCFKHYCVSGEEEKKTDEPGVLWPCVVGDPITYYILDLDDDGTYESYFYGYGKAEGIDPEKMLLFVLHLKYEQLQQKKISK